MVDTKSALTLINSPVGRVIVRAGLLLMFCLLAGIFPARAAGCAGKIIL